MPVHAAKTSAAIGTTMMQVEVRDMLAERQIWSSSEHGSEITSLAFSPDGYIMASGSKDRTIKLWNVQTGELFKDFQGHPEGITWVRFHPQGRFLASASGDLIVRTVKNRTGSHQFST
jgi:WD40 repeat protein